MFGFLLLVSALILGVAATRWLGFKVYRLEAAALVIVLGLFLWSWLALIFALLVPYAISLPLTVIAAAVLSWKLWHRRQWAGWQATPGGKAAETGWRVVAAATGLLFYLLDWSHDLLPSKGSLLSAGSTWADFGLHASLISHMAAASRLPLDLPIASGLKLTYPFLVDFLSAALVKVGWSLHTALWVPGLLLSWAICQLLIALSLRLFGQFKAAVISLTLILFGGATAATGAAWNDWRHSGVSLGHFLAHLPQDYTSLDSLNLHFNNLIADILLPQRGFLFGLGIFLIVAILIKQAEHVHEPRYQIAIGTLIGLLPMAHPHSFIAAMALLVAFTAQAWWRHDARLYNWLGAIGLALLLAAPQIAWQELANGHGTGGHWALGWMVNPGQSIWAFWWDNFGPTGLYLVSLPVILLRRTWRQYLVWYVPFLLILVVTQLYAFQPFAYDNLKLILYVYIMAMLAAGAMAVWLAKKIPASLVLLVPLLVITIIPGSLSVLHEFEIPAQFAGPDDIALANWAEANTKPSTVFLTTDTPNQPIATLAGRPIVYGYNGWLYSYNVDYTSRQEAVVLALAGQASSPAVTQFGAQYLVVGAYEDPSWQINPANLSHYTVTYQNPAWTVYKLPQ